MPDYGEYKRPQDVRFEDIPWGSIKKFIPPILIIIFVIITGYTAFYTVKANEEAVILRFGSYKETVGPGLHTKLPYGIDKILKGEVKRIYNEEFGFRTEQRGSFSMDGYKCGIDIQTVLLKGVNPPEPVKDAFNAVNQAIQIRDRIINEAEGQKNKILPAAEGKKQQVIKEAEGYRIRRVNEATGDIKAFLAVYEEYKKAEDVTRRRLYLETMSKVIPKCEKLYIIDKDIKGLLPMFDINQEGVQK